MLRRATDALLYSNVFVALCAIGFALASYRLLGLVPRADHTAWLIGGATLSGYLLLRLEGSRRLAEAGYADRLLWVVRNRRWAWALFGAGLSVALFGMWIAPPSVRLALLPAAGLAFGYGLPYLPLPLHLRLRRRNYLKIFLIAGVWAWVAVAIPWAGAGLNLAEGGGWSLLASRFLFVVAITLPFDIRDIETDRVQRIRTLPAVLGVSRSITLSRLLLLLAWCSLWPSAEAAYAQPWWNVMIPLGLLYALTAWLVGRSSRTGNDYLYLGWLDGTMLAHVLVLEAAWFVAKQGWLSV